MNTKKDTDILLLQKRVKIFLEQYKIKHEKELKKQYDLYLNK